jgi:hypothetical protein
MKKKMLILFCLIVVSISSVRLQAQSFIGITWKVNEYYLNNVRMGSGTIDSLRYHFKVGGTLEMRQPQMPTTQLLTYSYNASSSQINIVDSNQTTKVLKIIYSDINNLIFTTTDTDPVNGQILTSEFRMVPVSP